MADHQGKLYTLAEIGLVGGTHSPSSKDHQGCLLDPPTMLKPGSAETSTKDHYGVLISFELEPEDD
jgi:hypothetical protein